jgi:hypothetical protein
MSAGKVIEEGICRIREEHAKGTFTTDKASFHMLAVIAHILVKILQKL